MFRDERWEADDAWRTEAAGLLRIVLGLGTTDGPRPAEPAPEKVTKAAEQYAACDPDTWVVRIEVLQDVLFRTAYEVDLDDLPALAEGLERRHPGAGDLLLEAAADGFHAAGTLVEDFAAYDQTPPAGVDRAPAPARWLLEHTSATATAQDNETPAAAGPRAAAAQVVALIEAALIVVTRLACDGVLVRHPEDADLLEDWAGDFPYRSEVPVRPVPWVTSVPGRDPGVPALRTGQPVVGVCTNDAAWQHRPVVTGLYDEARVDRGLEPALVPFVVAGDVHHDCEAIRAIRAPDTNP